jgi:hypothetical protein
MILLFVCILQSATTNKNIGVAELTALIKTHQPQHKDGLVGLTKEELSKTIRIPLPDRLKVNLSKALKKVGLKFDGSTPKVLMKR